MEAPVNSPPIIERPRRSTEPAIFFACLAGAILVAVVSGYLGIGFPQCSFKKLTGLPCAFCGGTRSLRAIAHFHFAEAFCLNPLVTISVFVSMAGAILWGIAPRAFDHAIFKFKKLPLLVIGLTLVALNWVFVMKFLPR